MANAATLGLDAGFQPFWQAPTKWINSTCNWTYLTILGLKSFELLREFRPDSTAAAKGAEFLGHTLSVLSIPYFVNALSGQIDIMSRLSSLQEAPTMSDWKAIGELAESTLLSYELVAAICGFTKEWVGGPLVIAGVYNNSLEFCMEGRQIYSKYSGPDEGDQIYSEIQIHAMKVAAAVLSVFADLLPLYPVLVGGAAVSPATILAVGVVAISLKIFASYKSQNIASAA